MKRAGNLIEDIVEYDNLSNAFRKAKKGNAYSAEVQEYEANLNKNLIQLADEIKKGEVNVGNYRTFTIYDPKERQICAASFNERVLHHALMNVCDSIFERFQIFDSYACRCGKGTDAALKRAQHFAHQYPFFAKLDIRKYFETLPHEALKIHLRKRFKDPILLEIFAQIIDSFENSPKKGIPIGNLTSQYFANSFLAQADHFVKEQGRLKPYVRYMDDMVLFHADLYMLKIQTKRLENFIQDHLQCETKPTVINRIEKGLPFLGFVIWKDKMTLSQRSRKRFKGKATELYVALERNFMTESEFQQKMQSLLAFIQKSHSFSFRKSVISVLENG